MLLLLAVAGAAIGFGVGWAVARARQPLEIERTEPAPSPSATPSFADLCDLFRSGVVVADVDGVVTHRNAAAQALGGTHAGVLLDEVIERHVDAAAQGLASDEVLEMYGPPKAVLAIVTQPIPSGGSVVFIDDISERRRIDQVRTDFVANVSHELKTPIGALLVLAETLEDETDREVIRRVAGRMAGEAERASRVIDDLMELSRIELGGERLVGPVPIAGVIRDALARVEEIAARRSISISVLGPIGPTGQHDEALSIVGDRRQLASALGNLVENAVKYSEPERSVQIEAHSDGAVAEISIRDHGVGIPQRDLDRVFERFYRVDRARSRDTGGTGLGLSIVRHVVTNHDGEIMVTSIEGEGSSFVLRLPVGTTPSGDAPGSSVPSSTDHIEGVA